MQLSSIKVVGRFSCSWDDKTLSTTGTFPPRFSKTAEKVNTENCLKRLLRNVFNYAYLPTIDLLCRLSWNDSTCSPLLVTTTQWFSRNLSSQFLCSCLEILSTTNNLCEFRRRKLQRLSFCPFCSWDDTFLQILNIGSPNNLCKCTESTSTLSTNTSRECNLHLS